MNMGSCVPFGQVKFDGRILDIQVIQLELNQGQ